MACQYRFSSSTSSFSAVAVAVVIKTSTKNRARGVPIGRGRDGAVEAALHTLRDGLDRRVVPSRPAGGLIALISALSAPETGLRAGSPDRRTFSGREGRPTS